MVKIVNLGAAWPWPRASYWRPEAERETWFESTEEHHDEQLNVLPPIYFRGGFFVSEPSCDDSRGVTVFAAWVRIESAGRVRYFVREVPRDMIEHALAELSAALAEEPRVKRCATGDGEPAGPDGILCKSHAADYDATDSDDVDAACALWVRLAPVKP